MKKVITILFVLLVVSIPSLYAIDPSKTVEITFLSAPFHGYSVVLFGKNNIKKAEISDKSMGLVSLGSADFRYTITFFNQNGSVLYITDLLEAKVFMEKGDYLSPSGSLIDDNYKAFPYNDITSEELKAVYGKASSSTGEYKNVFYVLK